MYRPDDLEPHEAWVREVFEPVRQEHFMNLPRGPLLWYFSERDMLPASTIVALLIAKNPILNKGWLETLVFKHHRATQTFLIVSHGRRYFRTLVYASNSNFSLDMLQPSPDNRCSSWKPWQRYEAERAPGETPGFSETLRSYGPPPHEGGLVIIRHRLLAAPAAVEPVPEDLSLGDTTERPDTTTDGTGGPVSSSPDAVQQAPATQDDWVGLESQQQALGPSTASATSVPGSRKEVEGLPADDDSDDEQQGSQALVDTPPDKSAFEASSRQVEERRAWLSTLHGGH
jgi:hypothetical protein